MLLALIVGQVGLHATMAGVRMAAPLQALREGHSAWTVGVLLALLPPPGAASLHAGRLADRHGYHRPVRMAVGLSTVGALLAVASTFVEQTPHFALLCLSAAARRQRRQHGADRHPAPRRPQAARNSTERMRVFSWLGIAPALSNVVGPVAAGFMIDPGGFRAAFAAAAGVAAADAGLVAPGAARACGGAGRPGGGAARFMGPAAVPGLKRLLCVNWLLSASWDVHIFVVPILGHERGFSASTIGLILGTFTLAVTGVRLLIPLLAHRMSEVMVLAWPMLATGAVFALYPLAQFALADGRLRGAAGPGAGLGAADDHVHAAPDHAATRAMARRSPCARWPSTCRARRMPLVFGAAGAALGAAALFWLVGGAVASGSWLARRLPAVTR